MNDERGLVILLVLDVGLGQLLVEIVVDAGGETELLHVVEEVVDPDVPDHRLGQVSVFISESELLLFELEEKGINYDAANNLRDLVVQREGLQQSKRERYDVVVV